MPSTDPLMQFLQQKFAPQQLNVNPGQQLATPQLQRALSVALGQPNALQDPRNRQLLTQAQIPGGAGQGGQR